MTGLIRPRLSAAPPSALHINRNDPINAGLVGRWPMNDAGGRLTMRDVSGNNQPATLSTGIASSWIASPFQGVSAWKVITNDGVSLTALPNLSVFTMAGWFKYNTSSGAYQNIWTHTGSTGLWVKSDKLNWYTGTDHNSSATLTTGTWYHFALTCAGTGGTNASMYINGVLDTSGMPGYISAIDFGSIAADGGSSGSGEVLQGGALYDFGLWRRVLSAGEVARLATEPLGGITYEPDRVLRQLQSNAIVAVTSSITQSWSGLTQALAATEDQAGAITQSWSGLSQALSSSEFNNSSITQSWNGLSQHLVSETAGGITQLTFSDIHDIELQDWRTSGGASYLSSLTVGWSIPDDAMRWDYTPYTYVFLDAETQIVVDQNGDNVTDQNNELVWVPDSCIMNVGWNWVDGIVRDRFGAIVISNNGQIVTANTAKLTDDIQVYKHRENFLVAVSKNKVRGKGRSLQLNFRSVSDDNFNLLGWGIELTKNSGI